MKFCLAVFVLVAVFCCAKGQGSSHVIPAQPTVSPNATSSNLTSSIASSSLSSSISHSPIITVTAIRTAFPISPNVASTMIKPNNTKTVHPNNTHTIHPNVTTNPNMTKTHVPSNATVPVVSTSPSHSMGPTPHPTKSAGKDDKDYDNMKKRMWIAGSFAIIFSLTTVILAYLVYRQRKINRELSGDPASSRLL